MFQSKRKISKQPSFPSRPASPTSSSSPPPPAPANALTALLPPILKDGRQLPKLIVFDLDYTLWPFWVDTHVMHPLKPSNARHTAVSDRIGESFSFYKDVPSILWCLFHAGGVKLGLASRTHAPELGREMLKLLHISPPPPPPADETGAGGGGSGGKRKDKEKDKMPTAMRKTRKATEFFQHMEIYPSGKIKHFEALARKTGIPYADMLFFDDESRNGDVARLGVTFWLVRDGVDWREVERGIAEWRRRKDEASG